MSNHDIMYWQQQIINELKTICMYINQQNSDTNEQTVQQIAQYLDTNFADSQISLTSIGAHFNLSTAHISRIFRKKYSINFYKYLMNIRIQYARELLKTSDSSIGEISTLCGFTTPKTFRRVFKEANGVSPSDYKRSLK